MNHPTLINQQGSLHWSEERLFNQAEDYYAGLLSDIDAASTSIDLESYIFDRDAVGERIFEALINAHQRGVSVRVLLDGAGTYNTSGYYAAEMERAGLQVKIFHPLPWQLYHYRRSVTAGHGLTKLMTFFRRINQRDHRKLCIVDGLSLWSGSFNISAAHLPRESGGEGWRDYGLRVEGPVVKDIRQSFDDLWKRRRNGRVRGLFRYYWLNLTLAIRKRRNRLLLRSLRKSETRIWIVSAYFAPSLTVVRALRQAALRNVDVRIIVPRRSDIPFFPLLTATYYADLLSAGVKVYEYSKAMIHAKAVIIDDLCLIGSTNFNHRSFLHDLELDIQLKDPHSKQTLRQWFQEDMAASQAVSLKMHRPVTQRLIGAMAKLLRYWL